MRKCHTRQCASPNCSSRTRHPSRLCLICRRRREAQFAAEDALGDAMASRSCTGLTRDHLRDATKMAPAFDDPDAPESDDLTTEQALEQARRAVADGEAMLADLERNDRARQAEERDEAFSFDVALTREVMETMCQELTAARREAAACPRSKYHREIKPGVWVDVYDVLAAWAVDNPALQHLVKKALQPGERGHKTREQDLADIVASAKRAQELEGSQ